MNTELVCQVIIDAICLGIVWLPALLFEVIGQPFERGFYCDDTSIRYPYKDSTVTATVLFIYSLGLPITFIVVVEIFHWRYNIKNISKRLGRQESTSSPLNISSDPLFTKAITQILRLITVFLFGAACTELVTDSGKHTIGRLRPHFYDICKPESLDGSILCPLNGPPTYITNYICTGTDENRLKEARLSFPSGHASFSAYAMIFLVFYLQRRMNWSGSKLLRPIIQMGALMLTWYTSLSRVSDYKHHGSDVLFGFLIGAVAASLTALYVLTPFKQRSARYETVVLPEPQPEADKELLDNTNSPVSANDK